MGTVRFAASALLIAAASCGGDEPKLTNQQMADAIWEHLKPLGVAVVIEATHACMTARGVSTPGVMMTTSRMMGVFRDDERSRREVLALMGC